MNKSEAASLGGRARWAKLTPANRAALQAALQAEKIRQLPSLRERLESMYTPEPNSGCWLWTAYLNKTGYGRINVEGRLRLAHRAVWEMYRGPIPKGLYLDHMCRVTSCVNPDHLRAVTPRINTIENSLGPIAKNVAKKSCPRCGGPYTSFVEPKGHGRRCKACRNNDRAARAQKKLWEEVSA